MVRSAVLPGGWNESTSSVASGAPPRPPSPTLESLSPALAICRSPALDKPPSYSPTATATFVTQADPRACLRLIEHQLDALARGAQRLAHTLADAEAAAEQRARADGGRVRDLEQRVKELEGRLAAAVSRDQREAELLEALRQVPAGPFLLRMAR
ncbi:hypothetical protein HDZ31DRAFT_37968 [Schizophyllum fasciatum]